MRLRFIGSGDPTENAECVTFGLTFPVNQWVDLDAPPAKLLSNPTFEAERAPRLLQLDHDGDGLPGGSLPKRRRGGRGNLS